MVLIKVSTSSVDGGDSDPNILCTESKRRATERERYAVSN